MPWRPSAVRDDPQTTLRLRKPLKPITYPPCEATWRSGYATVCKTVYSGSIPDVASNLHPLRQVGTRIANLSTRVPRQVQAAQQAA